MDLVKSFFARKRIGFYVGLFTALLCLITCIIYASGFGKDGVLSEYASSAVWVLLLFAFLGFVGLSILPQTSKYASLFMGIMILIAFLLFVQSGYMYFSEIFYGEITMDGFFGMEQAYLWSMFLLIFLFILGHVSLYLKQEKQDEKKEKAEEVKKDEEASEVSV